MSAENPLVFVDTNILVYAYDQTAGQKHDQAQALFEELWDHSHGCLSVQVLQEFYVVITQKVPHPLPFSAAAGIVRDLSYWPVHSPAAEDFLGAVELQQRYFTSFWDAMILWSARQMHCSKVWSEDLSTGQVYDGMQVINPFLV